MESIRIRKIKPYINGEINSEIFSTCNNTYQYFLWQVNFSSHNNNNNHHLYYLEYGACMAPYTCYIFSTINISLYEDIRTRC